MTTSVNQLIILTVAGEQVGELTQRLKSEGFRFTQVDHGGLLQENPVSVLVGLDRADRERLLAVVREVCRTRRRFIAAQAEAFMMEGVGMMLEAEFGGATMVALDVDRFEQL